MKLSKLLFMGVLVSGSLSTALAIKDEKDPEKGLVVQQPSTRTVKADVAEREDTCCGCTSADCAKCLFFCSCVGVAYMTYQMGRDVERVEHFSAHRALKTCEWRLEGERSQGYMDGCFDAVKVGLDSLAGFNGSDATDSMLRNMFHLCLNSDKVKID